MTKRRGGKSYRRDCTDMLYRFETVRGGHGDSKHRLAACKLDYGETTTPHRLTALLSKKNTCMMLGVMGEEMPELQLGVFLLG